MSGHKRFAWDALDTATVLYIMVVLALIASGCALIPPLPPCEGELQRSPISGMCAVEGTDAWYGEDAAVPQRAPRTHYDTIYVPPTQHDSVAMVRRLMV